MEKTPEKIYSVELRTLPPQSGEKATSELKLHFLGRSLPIIRSASDRYVLDYLNGDARYIGGNIDALSLPTEGQRGLLREFVDTIIVGGGTIRIEEIASNAADIYGASFRYDTTAALVSCTPISASDDEPQDIVYSPAITRCFASLYDLFLYECFDMMQVAQPVYKCALCGKYFMDRQRSTKKYCSSDCRKEAARPKDEVSRLYSNAYKKANKKLNEAEIKGNTEYYNLAKGAFSAWTLSASAAERKVREGSISREEYKAILDTPLGEYLTSGVEESGGNK